MTVKPLPNNDPIVPDWQSLRLPDSWADQLDFSKASDLYRFLQRVFARSGGIAQVHPELYGVQNIPKYVLQEFHNLPNGNFSRKISKGYITGFDYVMLGEMHKIRQRIARRFSNCESVLDAGCAGGHTAAAIAKQGVVDVWGIDPSPYLLKHAAKTNSSIHFIHGVIEQPCFPAERFDAVCANFLFHEVPPRYTKRALDEIYRILKPGGELMICEPSQLQIKLTFWQAFKRYGFKGIYFKWLAGSVNEPFLSGWHNFAKKENFIEAGYSVLLDDDSLPIRTIILKK